MARPVKARTHAVDAELAGDRDLVVAQAAGLPHQEHIAIERGQPVERLAQRGRKLLDGRPRRVEQFDRHAAAAIVADVIQREIPGDAEDPGAASGIVGVGNRTARDAQKHFLRQLARFAVPDDAAEVAEDAVAVRREQEVCVCHGHDMPTL